ncbi:MAG: response regulator [Candidatus Marinimicrobia bacterium]|nr:response regulator [Candidatus Neomarinimicrobiota bacterium]MCF7827905.1 response regulator [Candidatus Neomarinimicrobiota bacterium]MCF7879340.1 response regulator [Candidatus Neomarinimicrobiota bacterium]
MHGQSKSTTCPVLFVEDSAEFRELVHRKYLNGCDVTLLESGQRFLETLRRRQFHFMLMDYQLPGDYSGEELIQIARSNGYDGAVIGVSSSEYLNRKLLKAGADVALPKREQYFLPQTIRQGLSLAEARGATVQCTFGLNSDSN